MQAKDDFKTMLASSPYMKDDLIKKFMEQAKVTDNSDPEISAAKMSLRRARNNFRAALLEAFFKKVGVVVLTSHSTADEKAKQAHDVKELSIFKETNLLAALLENDACHLAFMSVADRYVGVRTQGLFSFAVASLVVMLESHQEEQEWENVESGLKAAFTKACNVRFSQELVESLGLVEEKVEEQAEDYEGGEEDDDDDEEGEPRKRPRTDARGGSSTTNPRASSSSSSTNFHTSNSSSSSRPVRGRVNGGTASSPRGSGAGPNTGEGRGSGRGSPSADRGRGSEVSSLPLDRGSGRGGPSDRGRGNGGRGKGK